MSQHCCGGRYRRRRDREVTILFYSLSVLHVAEIGKLRNRIRNKKEGGQNMVETTSRSPSTVPRTKMARLFLVLIASGFNFFFGRCYTSNSI